MAQQISEHAEAESPSRPRVAVMEYASPVIKPRRSVWGGVLALAVYGASLLLPAIEVQILTQTPDPMPGYAAAYWAFAMTVQTVQGQWMGPFPMLGTAANACVIASIALLLFSRRWRTATWTAFIALSCTLGCLPLFTELRVGYVVWLLSAIVCLVVAIRRRRRASVSGQ